MRRNELKAKRDELLDRVKAGEEIFLDCQFCGRITRVHADSVISYTAGDESYETLCDDCFSPEDYDFEIN